MTQRSWIFVALLALGGVGFAWLALHDDATRASHLARKIEERNAIRVAFGSPETFYVPPYTSAALEGVRAQRAQLDQAVYALDAVERALDAYPAAFARKLISAVFICGELEVGGARADGSYGPTWLVVGASAARDADGTFAAAYRAVHHELSSFVLRHDPDTYAKWSNFSPPGWRFSTSGSDEVARLEGAAPDPELGFISGYGSTSLENDFNSYAEEMFSQPDNMIALAIRYPRVRAKLDFVIDSYLRIDPTLEGRLQQLGVLNTSGAPAGHKE